MRLTEEREKEIRDAKSASTNVVAWYAHPYEGRVRGPFCRWFQCSEVETQYYKNVAPRSDDVKYCAISMNAVPELLAEIDALREELKDYELLHRRTVELVFPGERDSPGAYKKLLKDTERERDKLRATNEKYRDVLKKIGDYSNDRVSMILAREALTEIERILK